MKKIQTLDGLRGLAVISVLLVHLPQVTNAKIGELIYKGLLKSPFGYIGVDVFFALSGFLITRILLKEKIRGDLSIKRFYLKRLLRIFPIYYLLIILLGIFVTWKHMGGISLYLSNYIFAFDLSPHPLRHTWSLAVEEHFYLFWPFLISSLSINKAKNLTKFWIPAIAILSGLLTYIFFDKFLSELLIYRGTNYRMLTLSLGSYLAFIEDKIFKLQKNKVAFLAYILIPLLILGTTAKKIPLINHIPALVQMICFSLASVIILILTLQLENSTSKISNIFTSKIITFIGMISYGLYLYHYPIIYIFHKYTGNKPASILEFLILISIIVIIPLISYFFVEKPLLRLKEKMTSTSEKKNINSGSLA